MGFNEIVFGGMALIGILIFLYIGRYRAVSYTHLKLTTNREV